MAKVDPRIGDIKREGNALPLTPTFEYHTRIKQHMKIISFSVACISVFPFLDRRQADEISEVDGTRYSQNINCS
jgi:hypothetical protein